MTVDLAAENARLRELLWDNGIDPDPAPPAPPQFGPPTHWEWMMHQAMVRYVEREVLRVLEAPNFLTGEDWGNGARVGTAVRIRVPQSFTVELHRA